MKSDFQYASIIIDDPLLRENYGFLNYLKLLNLMDKHNFCTSIAFIPFNFKRTENKIATLFKDRPDRFSLCVHGCDHVKGEFGRTDRNYLDMRVTLATARMIEHEKRTGIQFDRIIVFPQGIFSNEALQAFKRNGYLAAVNTEATATDGYISSTLPFFLRYKPEDINHCASDPLFIVLHHDYFKNGYERLTDIVDELNARSKNLTWGSVGDIVRHFVLANAVNYDPIDAELSGWKFHGCKQNLKILLRRYGSEFRDNYLCKNDYLLNIANKYKYLIAK